MDKEVDEMLTSKIEKSTNKFLAYVCRKPTSISKKIAQFQEQAKEGPQKCLSICDFPESVKFLANSKNKPNLQFSFGPILYHQMLSMGVGSGGPWPPLDFHTWYRCSR